MSVDAMKRRCAVSGCETAPKRGHLMCLAHWRRVPRAEQAEVNDSWRAFMKGAGQEGSRERLARYRAAAKAATDAVMEKPEGGRP
ncbi:MAG: hypothetical protein HKM95_11705 [Inquilinus sp.]|nr:hypothetical protein [Inquilinus sp.]